MNASCSGTIVQKMTKELGTGGVFKKYTVSEWPALKLKSPSLKPV